MEKTKTLSDILTEERLREGWSIREPADHILELRHRGKLVARFSQTGTTIEKIEHEIRRVERNN